MALHPTVLEHAGKPAFVVLPYAEYLALAGTGPQLTEAAPDPRIPVEVMPRVLEDSVSVVRAWREHLRLT